MAHSTTRDKVMEAGDQLSAKACGVIRTAEQTAGDLAQKAQERLDSLSQVASDYVQQGQKKAQQLTRSVSGEVRERPMAALLAAAGLGLLIGVYLKRR